MSETVKAEALYEAGHAENPVKVSTSKDVDKVIDDLIASDSRYGTLAQIFSMERAAMDSGYPDHELIVGVDKRLKLGVLTFMDENGNFATVGAPDTRDEPIYLLMGHMRELPKQCEISVDLAREAMKEFIATGGKRPECVEWKPIEW